MSRQSANQWAPPLVLGCEGLLVHGFQVLPSMIEPATVAELVAEAEQLTSQVGSYEADLAITCLDSLSELVFDVARLPGLLEAAEEFIGKAVVPIRNDLRICRQPDGLARQHQHAYEEHFNDELAVTFWMPLPTSGSVNIEYASEVPGRLLPHVPHRGIPDALAGQPDLEFTSVVATPGELLAQHAYAVHRITRPYRAYTFTYRGSSYREAQRRRAGRSR